MIFNSPGSKKDWKQMHRERFQVGDRVITNNCRLGTVIRLSKDDFGEYVVVRLDILPGEYAYESMDLEKISSDS